MSDTAAETKESQAVTSPEKKEKEVVCERKPKEAEEEKKTEDKPETNGHSKTEEATKDSKPVENGDTTEVCSLPQKRKSEVDSVDASEKSAEGATPEKKPKLDEKVENGEAEATA